MTKNLKAARILVLITVTAFACACVHRGEKPATGVAVAGSTSAGSASDPASWAGRMQKLSVTLSDLLPLVASPWRFAAEANQARIEADVTSLRLLAHSLSKDTNKGQAPENRDPAMPVVEGLFAEDIDRALESLHAGNREYARAILKDTANYCITCHTQTRNGPSYPKLSLDINMKDLPRLERAEFYAATRQFDLAVDEFKAALKDPSLPQTDAFAWERAARSALAIVVRVQKNPDKAVDFIESIIRNKQAPAYVREPAIHWLKSAKEWRREREPGSESSADGLSRASALIAKAQAAQKFPLDHSQDVLWFRAGSLLHDLLGQPSLDDAARTRALFLAGVDAEATRDMNFWTMHETYFELCIKRSPHSAQAQQCFDRLNDSTTLGYSGSAGVLIPPEVHRRLETLRRLAAGEPTVK